MTLQDQLILFWLLPSLVTALLMIWDDRTDGIHPEAYSATAWTLLLLVSVIYPLGLLCLIIFTAAPALIKER